MVYRMACPKVAITFPPHVPQAAPSNPTTPLEGAVAAIAGPTTPSPSPVSTDTNGLFQFSQLLPGDYTVTVTNSQGQYDIFITPGTYQLGFSATSFLPTTRNNITATAGASLPHGADPPPPWRTPAFFCRVRP